MHERKKVSKKKKKQCRVFIHHVFHAHSDTHIIVQAFKQAFCVTAIVTAIVTGHPKQNVQGWF